MIDMVVIAQCAVARVALNETEVCSELYTNAAAAAIARGVRVLGLEIELGHTIAISHNGMT